jgi:ectoine utilization protein EutC
MPRITILTEAELRRIVPLDLEAVACIEQAFVALATEAVVMPPILRLDIPQHNGEVDVKTAYVPGLDSFAIKVSPGFFDNPKIGLPSVNGLMVLLSARTGLVDALLLDNGYLTDVRTAAAGAVAAKHIARPDSQVAAVFGAGVQACLQLKALMLVRPIREARIWARRPDRADALASQLRTELGIDVRAEQRPEGAVAGADVIVTTTPAVEPVLSAAWLTPGQHVTAMGSDAEHKNELEPAVLTRADVYVADSLAQVRRLGELHHAIQAGAIAADAQFSELGAVIAGRVPGRTSRSAISVCDLTGTGVQDTAIATLARMRAATAGIGTILDS